MQCREGEKESKVVKDREIEREIERERERESIGWMNRIVGFSIH